MELLLLLLAIFDCQKIMPGKENHNLIHCTEDDGWSFFNSTGMKCSSSCSENCTCLLDDDKVISNCTSGHVTMTGVIYLPSDYIVRYLTWEDSILHDIKAETFLRFGIALETLNLNNISLQHLQSGVFVGLERLKALYLTNNRLKWIVTGAFEELVQLEFLLLSNNKLTDIHVGMLSGLVWLEDIRLDGNMLTKIKVGPFNRLINLNVLFFFNNSISVIEMDSFAGLINLTRIYLNYNNISYLQPNVFEGLINLEVLSLHNNFINILHVEIFQNLIKLEYLYLENNKLLFLPKDIFSSLQRLRFINVSFNNLHRIPAELFLFCVSLETVDLQENPLLWIEKHSLARLNDSAQLIVTDFATCCFTPARCISSPPLSPYITCRRLLPYSLLRIAIWFVCGFAVLGNGFVFYTRVKQNFQKRNRVQLFIITNLCQNVRFHHGLIPDQSTFSRHVL